MVLNTFKKIHVKADFFFKALSLMLTGHRKQVNFSINHSITF